MGQTEELLAHGGKPIGVLVPHPGVAASHKSSWSWGAEAPGLNPSPHFSLLPSPGSHCFPLCVSESVCPEELASGEPRGGCPLNLVSWLQGLSTWQLRLSHPPCRGSKEPVIRGTTHSVRVSVYPCDCASMWPCVCVSVAVWPWVAPPFGCWEQFCAGMLMWF